MVQPRPALADPIADWLQQWSQWLQAWLSAGVEHPDAAAVLALQRWLQHPLSLQVPALQIAAARLLDAEQTTALRCSSLLDLCSRQVLLSADWSLHQLDAWPTTADHCAD
ncbi:hypothetical protein [Aquimonas sp.]|uniref:hypothetical protein n=1 Tax=Aquimonas sp. TaxID=1872588 RepID=UPI0037BFAFEF